ncbi:MAG: HAD-IA family hydrolase [gamma proteobacterium symbiont of Taylorina sp.]|nr:HAD-IA family hydrolase [gamma proteobacterium symbiont of Taylorina sp.]
MNKKYKLIIFDWDGTLMDSQQKIVQTLRTTLLQLNLVDRSDDTLKNVIGLGLGEAVRQLYPELNAQQIKHFSELYRHIFLSPEQAAPHLFDGISNMIKKLHQCDVMIAIATGKGRQGLEHAIGESGIRSFIHASRCADETFSKPNPQMLCELLDEFSLTASDAIMVGDTVYDLEMANNIKMDSLGVSYGVHDIEYLLEQKPIMICDTVEQLEHNLLENITAF